MTDPGNIAIALVAAIWARENARGAAFERVNQIRDRILIGKVDGESINLEHRKLMYTADWFPLSLAAIAICFFFAIISAVLPFVILPNQKDSHTWMQALCVLLALYQFCDGVASVVCLWRDKVILKKCLDGNQTTIKSNSVSGITPS